MRIPTGGSRRQPSSSYLSSIPQTPLCASGGTLKVPSPPSRNPGCSQGGGGGCCSDGLPSLGSPASPRETSGGKKFLPRLAKPTSSGPGGGSLPHSPPTEPRRLEREYVMKERPTSVFPNGVLMYTGMDRSSSVPKAIKIYPAEEMTEEKRRRVRHEAQMGLDLPPHPQVVNTIDFFEAPNRLAIVMDLWEGGTLLDYLLRRGPLSERQSGNIIAQLLQALAHLHANHVMHRDVKPENIFLLNYPSDENSNPLLKQRRASGTLYASSSTGNENNDGGALHIGLGDLSLSTSKIPNSDYVGSPQYSSPEMAMIALRKEFRNLGKPLYNEKCDVWSAGVLTFVLLTQLLPFDGDSAEEVFLSVLKNMIPFDKGPRISPEAKNFILSLTKSNPGSRPTAKDALRHPWIKMRHLSYPC